jgi:apolipoprotein N-acyltransferase
MSAFTDHAEMLERHEFQMGRERGRLAVAMDVLTDALVLVGQHGVYCRSARQPGSPAMDVRMISKSIEDAKELISSVIVDIRRQKIEEARVPEETD